MEAHQEDHVAFHLTGRRPASGSAPGKDLRPALMSRYRDLSALRYDYPLVLAEKAAGAASVRSLSGLFDELTAAVAQGADADRLRHHALRLEREIRRGVVPDSTGTLSARWATAEKKLAE